MSDSSPTITNGSERPPYSDPRAFDPPPDTSWGKLLALVPTGARVLDVGCAYGGFASAMRRLRGCNVVGVEIDSGMAAAARAHCNEVYEGDIAEIVKRLPADFDAVVAADVLEHLAEPEPVLRALSRCLRPGGIVLASIPNVTHLSVIVALAEGRFPRSREGLLDRTHLRFFGEEDVIGLFHSAGMAARVAEKVVTEPGSTEFHTDVRALPLAVLEYLSNGPNAQTYQFIVRGVPRSWRRPVSRESPGPRNARASSRTCRSSCTSASTSTGSILPSVRTPEPRCRAGSRSRWRLRSSARWRAAAGSWSGST